MSNCCTGLSTPGTTTWPYRPALRIMSDDGFNNPGEFVALPGHKSRFVFTGFFYPDQAGLVRDAAARTVIQDMEAHYRTNFHRADLPLGWYGSDRVPP